MVSCPRTRVLYNDAPTRVRIYFSQPVEGFLEDESDKGWNCLIFLLTSPAYLPSHVAVPGLAKWPFITPNNAGREGSYGGNVLAVTKADLWSQEKAPPKNLRLKLFAKSCMGTFGAARKFPQYISSGKDFAYRHSTTKLKTSGLPKGSDSPEPHFRRLKLIPRGGLLVVFQSIRTPGRQDVHIYT